MKTYHSFSSGSTSVNFDLTSSNSEVKTLLEQGRNDGEYIGVPPLVGQH